MKNGNSRFTDETAESAVVGTIATGLFDKIPESKLIPTQAFHDDRWRIVYSAAYSLRMAGAPVCAGRVNDLIEMHRQDGALQKAFDPTNTFQWRDWPIHCDQSLGFCPTTLSVEHSLETLGELFEKRESLGIAKRIEAGELSPREAIEALQEIVIETPSLLPTPRPLVDFAGTAPDHNKTILGSRFLCVEGGMLFVGPSGIGKTSASVQQDLLWSIGKPAFGIKPSRPLKILTIQAEDDDGDLSEIVSGVKAGLNFTPEQCRQSQGNCCYVSEKSHTGIEFLEKIVRPLLEKHRPDLLRINPFHAYLGGDVKDTALTANFLRNHLNPLLAHYQCACIVVHHTPKVTFRDTTTWKSSDWMYAGAGAADITNWCRAALIIDPTANPHVFRFIAAKRASRIGWHDEITGDREFIRYFAHDDGKIYWREAMAEEAETAKGKQGNDAERVLGLVPPLPLDIFRPEIVTVAKAKLNFGQHRTRLAVSILIEQGALEVVPKPRHGTKNAEFLRRTE